MAAEGTDARVEAVLAQTLTELETNFHAYFAGMIGELITDGELTSADVLNSKIGEHLETYDAVSDESAAYAKCVQIFQALMDNKVIDTSIKSKDQRKKDALVVGAQVMGLYYEDECWYRASLDEVCADGSYAVTFTEYGNQEYVTWDQIKPLDDGSKKEKMLKKRFKVNQGAMADGENLVNKLLYKQSVAVNDTKEGVADVGLTSRQRKLLRRKQKEREKVDKFSADRYFKEMKKSFHEEWLHTQSGSRDVHIDRYTMRTLDGSRVLMENANITLVYGHRYGFIGKNGCGKTTLLKMISRYAIEDFPTNLRVYHVEQEMPLHNLEMSVVDYILNSDVVYQHLKTREAVLVARPDTDAAAGVELGQIYEKLKDLGLDNVRDRAIAILKGLGFRDDMLVAPTKSLSGGWRMRAALAAALFVSPDILLLDEPTNHLDFPSVIWLEKYLINYPKTIVIVSHDRTFLDNTVTHIMHLAASKLTYYKGNFNQFIKTKNEKYRNQLKAYNSQQDNIKDIQAFIDKFRYNAKRASLVQSRIKLLKSFVLVEKPQDDSEFQFYFPKCPQAKDAVFKMHDLVFGYSTEKILLDKIDLAVSPTGRIGLIGGNGTGKSTLIKLMMEELEPLHGEVWRNRQCRISVFTQHHIDQLDLTMSPMDYLLELFHDELVGERRPGEIVRNKLGSFGINEELCTKRMMFLSGGQKSRVAFSVITWLSPNFIIMDEPTNHLDIETIDALINAINAYEGGLFIVSHDQHFLEQVVKPNHFWAVTNKKLRRFETLAQAKEHESKLKSQYDPQ